MDKIKLKSRLVIRLVGNDEITLDELHDVEDFLLNGGGIDFSPEEIENIKHDLEYVFLDMKTYGRSISFVNCPDSIRDYILKHSPVPDVFFEEHVFFEAQREKKKVSVSDEFKICIGDEDEITEAKVYKYVKTAKLWDIKPSIAIKDIDLVIKYALLSDFRIKVNNKDEYEKLMTTYNEIPKDIIISREFLLQMLNGEVEISKELTVSLWIKFLSELSDELLGIIEKNRLVSSIEITYGLKPTNEYTINELIEIKETCSELANSVDMSLSELERFMSIYQILGREIEYEFDDDGEPSSRKEAHNLVGGLFENSAVCEGYSKILEQILNYVGIECKCVFGKTEVDSDKGHAWNQVKLDGKWYNCDLTWDATKMKYGMELEYCLQSDDEFVSHISEISDIEECQESYDREKIKELMEYSIEAYSLMTKNLKEQRKLLSEIRGEVDKGKYFGHKKASKINNTKTERVKRISRYVMEK